MRLIVFRSSWKWTKIIYLHCIPTAHEWWAIKKSVNNCVISLNLMLLSGSLFAWRDHENGKRICLGSSNLQDFLSFIASFYKVYIALSGWVLNELAKANFLSKLIHVCILDNFYRHSLRCLRVGQSYEGKIVMLISLIFLKSCILAIAKLTLTSNCLDWT